MKQIKKPIKNYNTCWVSLVLLFPRPFQASIRTGILLLLVSSAQAKTSELACMHGRKKGEQKCRGEEREEERGQEDGKEERVGDEK